MTLKKKLKNRMNKAIYLKYFFRKKTKYSMY